MADKYADGALLMLIAGAHCPHCEERAWPAHFNKRGRFKHCLSRKARKANRKEVSLIMADLERSSDAVQEALE